MTMRVSLVLDGDASGASKAVQLAINDLNKLIDKTNRLAEKTRPVGEGFKEAGQTASTAIKLSEQQLAQMQFQLQDMAVGLTSGQSPFTVMMQQGSQLSQMFRGGTGVMGALKAVGGGIVAFLTNPLNLAVVGFGLAASAAASFYNVMTSEGSGANSLLEQHDAMIKLIGESWDNSEKRVKRYAHTVEGMLLNNALVTQKEEQRALVSMRKDVGRTMVPIPSSGDASLDKQIAGLELQFKEQLRQGVGDVKKFLTDISTISVQSGVEGAQKLVQALGNVYQPLVEAQDNFDQTTDIIKGLRGNTTAMNDALGTASDKVSGLTRRLGELSNGAAFAAAQQGGLNSPARWQPSTQTDFMGKALLDLIAEAEGTARGRNYNETLGYGKFTGGNVDLVTMRISEVLDLQKRMLAHPENNFNSSAVGRYQITRQTLLHLMPELGLNGDDVFGPSVQDQLALARANMTKGDPRKLDSAWVGLQKVNDSLKTQAFDGAFSQRSGVANQIASQAEKLRVNNLKEQEEAEEKLIATGAKWAAVIANTTAQENQRADAVGKTVAEQARSRTEQQLWQQANSIFGDRLKEDKKLYAEVAAEIRKVADASGVAASKQDDWKKAREASAESEKNQITRMDEMRGTFGGMTSTFLQAKQQGQGWGGALNSVLDSVASKLGNVADKLIDSLLFGKQGTSGGGLLGGLFASLLPAAKGAAFAGGVMAFANGGTFANSIVDAPTFFRYGGSQLGVMGEAGPEAIMPLTGGNRVRAMTGQGQGALPLTRMPDGSLGVDLRGPRAFAQGASFGGAVEAALGGTSGKPVVNLNLHNYSGEKAEAKVSQGRNGEINIDAMVGQALNRHIAQGGADAALNTRYSGLTRRAERNG